MAVIKLKRSLHGKFHQHLDDRYLVTSLVGHFVREAVIRKMQ
jgi:hypothetical protein